jgi:hypothetical protein
MTTPSQGKKPLNERVKATIAHLERLIDHDRTSEEERGAAHRALQRIAEAYEFHSAAQRSEGPGFLYNPGAWAGEKYCSTAGLAETEIAKLIRQDIKLARKVGRRTAPKNGEVAVPDPLGDAPRAINFSVRTRYSSTHAAIDVTIKNIPEDWGWTTEFDGWGNPIRTATPAMVALYREVEKIHAAYNYDNSDAMTDYFDRKYWGSVSTEVGMRLPRY